MNHSWLRGRVFSLPLFVVLIGLLVVPAAHAAPGWYSPVTVNGTQSFAPDVATDGSGKAYAVWINDGPFDLIKAAVRPAEGLSFGAAQTISSASKDAFEPKIASSASGEAAAVWSNTTDGTVELSVKPAASNTFSGPLVVSGTGSFRPDVSVDPQGNVTVVWVRQVGANTIIESRSRPPGGPFSAIEQVSENNFVSDNPQVAPEETGYATAVWTRFDPGTSTSIIQTSARREENFPRPGSGTPLRVPLVPAYKQCTAPNSTHVTPLNLPSCSNTSLESAILRMGVAGAGAGFLRYNAVPGTGTLPPDDADVSITLSLSDVRCAVSGPTGCSLADGDYTGQVVVGSTIRLTDRGNGSFQDDGGTVQDTQFTFPVSCVATPLSLNGSTCDLSTTADTLVPNMMKERNRSLFQVRTVEVKDMGANGTITPGAGTCPPTCGNGDEKVYVHQGVFLP